MIINNKIGSPQRYLSIFKTAGLALFFSAITMTLSACNNGGSSLTVSGAGTELPNLDHQVQPSFTYSSVGNPRAPVTVPRHHATASFVLMGGGNDVDSAFRWMISRAGIRPGTGGHFVVLKATPSDGYDPYIYYSDETSSTSTVIADQWVGGAALGLSSVETLIVPDINAANDPRVSAIVSRADAVFIGGGDQSNYVKYWKATRLDAALQQLLKNNVPLGGTSAGLSVLGQFDFSALYDSISSDEAMKNPYDKNITFDPDPLSLSGGFIAPPELAYMMFDSHFDGRARMGRLITFLSRLIASDGRVGCPGGILSANTSSTTSARGIGIDEETALLVQGNGAFQPVTAMRATNISTSTESAVYFVRPSVAPSVCANQTPLTIHSVEVKKLADSATVFNLSDWSGVPIYEFLDVDGGILSPQNWV